MSAVFFMAEPFHCTAAKKLQQIMKAENVPYVAIA